MPINVGDMVRVYGYERDMTKRNPVGEVREIHAKTGWFGLLVQGRSLFVHPKQCRKLKEKHRTRFWVEMGTMAECDNVGGFFRRAYLQDVPALSCREFVEAKHK